MPLDQRRKFIGMERSKAGPYFCRLCGGLGESVYHLMCECEELIDWTVEVYGRGIMILSDW